MTGFFGRLLRGLNDRRVLGQAQVVVAAERQAGPPVDQVMGAAQVLFVGRQIGRRFQGHHLATLTGQMGGAQLRQFLVKQSSHPPRLTPTVRALDLSGSRQRTGRRGPPG